ncbi:MAG TPA: hypothetical protein VN611_15190 [Patescibacteria group bacterium]|nr:hypothetical protein [Patescibacteria group bacterium]
MVNITLNGVDIEESHSTSFCAFAIDTGTTVNLTLKGYNTLKGGSYSAGIGVPSGATLTVTAVSSGSGGTVTATGGRGGFISGGGAGIGGSVDAKVSYDVDQSSGSSTKVYKTTVEGLPGSSAVTGSISGGDEFSCETDESGQPAGHSGAELVVLLR